MPPKVDNSKIFANRNLVAKRWLLRQLQQAAKERNCMTPRSSMLTIAGLAIAGWLAGGISAASAQTVVVDSYAGYPDPYVGPYASYGYVESPIVEAPVVVAPRSAYIAAPPVVAPAPIVRERTVVVRRPGYVRHNYLANTGYVNPDFVYADW
jgi:hypothetical protein